MLDMAKAVLIMDMPERCDKCPLLLKIPQKNGLALCLARPTNGQEEYNPKHEKSWRSDWCPLRELPEKKDTLTTLECHSNGKWTEGMKAGWNACLDAIEGGAHGKEQSK